MRDITNLRQTLETADSNGYGLTAWESDALAVSSDAPGAYLGLVGRLKALRESNSGTASCVFAALTPGAGTTHVVRGLATALRGPTGQRVACLTSTELIEPAKEPRKLLRDLRGRFDYVLVDCPALQQSADALIVARDTQGVCLVIEAGKNTRAEVLSAVKVLSMSSVPVIGFVLNKQEDPVPKFLSRIL